MNSTSSATRISEPPTPPARVTLQNLSKQYGSGRKLVNVFEDISLTFEHGEFISLVGPSGCGKSTLLHMISGLHQPSAGAVHIGDSRVNGAYRDCGIVFQEPALLEWRTALGNVLLQAEIRKLPRKPSRERAHHLLKMAGLAGFEQKFPDELSGGMRQRVALCRALLHDPPLLLMDEPFGALDAITRDKMNLDLQEIVGSDQKTVIFVTHDIEEACFLGDRVVVMAARPSRIVRDVTIDIPRPRRIEVRNDPAFQEYVSQIRGVFEDMGIFDDAK